MLVITIIVGKKDIVEAPLHTANVVMVGCSAGGRVGCGIGGSGGGGGGCCGGRVVAATAAAAVSSGDVALVTRNAWNGSLSKAPWMLGSISGSQASYMKVGFWV